MSRQLTIGLMLVMLCGGLSIAFMVIIAMTPDFTNFTGAGWIFVLLAIGFLYGAHEINQADKVLRKVDRGELIPPPEPDAAIPDWRA